jgi:hypothetical protein
MRTLMTFGLGALAMYLLDPRQGRARRAFMRERIGAVRRWARSRAEGARPPELSFREYAGSTQSSPVPDSSTEAPQSARHLGR